MRLSRNRTSPRYTIYSRISSTYGLIKTNGPGGDSQFDEISAGLGWCDYGVVFLSKQYLQKGWTNAEFRGLWTKQIERRSKVILPIWYDVTKDDVYKFSAMVADLTAFRSQDAAQIAEWIQAGPLYERRQYRSRGHPCNNETLPLGRAGTGRPG
jgi:hypothetical protein